MTWLELEGAVNVRDIGGLRTDDGRTTAHGVLIRSDNLQGLTDKDVRLLVEEHGVRTVLDLRTPAEVEGEGPGPLVTAGVGHVRCNLIPGWDPRTYDAARVVPHERREKNDLSHHYINYLEEAGDQVVEALRVLADPSRGTTVVHCAAGKDRTGVIVALALLTAGVPREEVVADYALTAERIDAIYERLRTSPTYAEDMRHRPIDDIRPHALSMWHFFDRMDGLGGVPTWLAQQGFGAEEQAALRARLVA